MSLPAFEIVVAADEKLGIGKDGDLPWKLPGDMAHFKTLTSTPPAPGQTNVVIMGRRTWDSIPARFRPLPGRTNVVLTRNHALKFPDTVQRAGSLQEALRIVSSADGVGRIFVIGGASVYHEAIGMSECQFIHFTRVRGRFACDTFFPQIHPPYQLENTSDPHNEGKISYEFQVYRRR